MGKTVRTTETFCYCSYSFCNSRAGRLGEKCLRSSNEESLYFVSEGSSSNTVIVTACLTIIIPLNRLLSTLSWSRSEVKTTTKTTWIAADLRSAVEAIWVFLGELFWGDVQRVHFYTKNKLNSLDLAFIDIFSLCGLSAHFRLQTSDGLKQTETDRQASFIRLPGLLYCGAVVTTTWHLQSGLRYLQSTYNILI